MRHVEEILQAVSEELGGASSGEAVIGSAVQLGPVTAYPVSLVSLGLGGGGGEGEQAAAAGGAAEKGIGGGSAGGARACPVAVVAFTPDGVKVLPLPQRKGAVERLMEKSPDLVGRVKAAAGEGGGPRPLGPAGRRGGRAPDPLPPGPVQPSSGRSGWRRPGPGRRGDRAPARPTWPGCTSRR